MLYEVITISFICLNNLCLFSIPMLSGGIFYYVRYSEHPYVEANIMKTKVNVVPCYDVKIGNWKSSADRSPFHTKYMQEMLTQEMKNEVRILRITSYNVCYTKLLR